MSDLQQWTDEFNRLVEQLDNLPWRIGDLANQGKRDFGRAYTEGISDKIDYGQLRQYARLAESFPADMRRPGLSFRHYRTAARVPERQMEFLNLAVEQSLSPTALKRLIAKERKSRESQQRKEETSLAEWLAQGRRMWQQLQSNPRFAAMTRAEAEELWPMVEWLKRLVQHVEWRSESEIK